MMIYLSGYHQHMASGDKTERKKTSISIDPQIWDRWLHFVLDRTGSMRKTSEELEKAIVHYMECDLS